MLTVVRFPNVVLMNKKAEIQDKLIQPLYYCIGEVILNKRVFSIDVII